MDISYNINTNLLRVSLIFGISLLVSACGSEDSGRVITELDPSSPNLAFSGLVWEAPSRREDNTQLGENDIESYRVYYGELSRNYTEYVEISSKDEPQFDTSELQSGLYYIVVVTVDSEGRESQYTEELELSIN